MSIKFKVIERGEPGVKGGGLKKFYASPVTDGEIDLDALTKAIAKISTVSGADIRAVLYALVDSMDDMLADGKIIRLGELGSLRVSFSSEGLDNEDLVNAKSIKSAKVLFTPGKMIKKMLLTLDYKKM
ncbi:MAG: HU family DNA-binding protein [Bacteroidales bacterium]